MFLMISYSKCFLKAHHSLWNLFSSGDVAQAPRLKDISIWAFHGSADKAVPVCRSRDMVSAIKAAGGKKVEYKEYKGLGHNVWTPTFTDDKVFEWLFARRRAE